MATRASEPQFSNSSRLLVDLVDLVDLELLLLDRVANHLQCHRNLAAGCLPGFFPKYYLFCFYFFLKISFAWCRSASKERPRDSTTEENEYLETELNNILRGQNINNNNNNNQSGFEKTNGSGGN